MKVYRTGNLEQNPIKDSDDFERQWMGFYYVIRKTYELEKRLAKILYEHRATRPNSYVRDSKEI